MNESTIEMIVWKTRQTFNTDRTKNIQFRIKQLKQLRKCLTENYDRFMDALLADLDKPKAEASGTEMLPLLNDIDYQLKYIHYHTRVHYTKTKHLTNIFDSTYVHYEPLGVVLIISPWNYPLTLSIRPLVGAIAAGNCAILKPSEFAPNYERLLAELLPKYLDPECYRVVTGDASVSSRLLENHFDLIFFTGSPSIGKIVYRAATKFLTPCVMELGGKNPAYLDNNVNDFYETAKRIIWAKCINKGQVCIAPDYLICMKKVQDQFIKLVPGFLKEFYGNDASQSPFYGRIVNRKNFEHLRILLESNKEKVVIGGNIDVQTGFFPLTIMANVTFSDPIMQKEIFGPILPIVTVESLDEALTLIRQNEKPLAINVYTDNDNVFKRFQNETSSGTIVKNDHFFNLHANLLPFGGVGNSGFGNYYGPYSFRTFSHAKSVMIKRHNFITNILMKKRYPPYSDSNLRIFSFLLARNFIDDIDFCQTFRYLLTFITGILITLFIVWILSMKVE
ncbi:aldehyde dehydrogenase 3, member A2 [Dermatophagoides pteronyssinus]|uniref:Aldehyde dehydrogenase n=1 Tax=Dermatophagoides pteronyssinus TaxID=6956 RepID=A0ABQ8J809_DERPT|nr:aldehyde dehydrogenase 3, member A2 [Dermatophagoides pteronyssinus]